MAVRDPSGVPASGSLSSSSRTSCIFCPPMPDVLKHSKTVFQDMNKTNTKGLCGVGWWGRGGGGGGTLKLLLLCILLLSCIHCEIHIKSQHRSFVQVQNYVAITRTLNCTLNAVEKNINEFITSITISHFIILITLFV